MNKTESVAVAFSPEDSVFF